VAYVGLVTRPHADDEMVPGPDGNLITGREANRLHRLARVCMPSPPGCTEPLIEFHERLHHTTHFLGSAFRLAGKLDQTLDSLFPDQSERSRTVHYEEAVAVYRPLLGQLMVTQAVDLYLQYVADLLEMIYVTQPLTLRSSRQVKLEEVLQFTDMDDLVKYLATEQVNRLSFRGLREIDREVRKELGLSLAAEDTDLHRLAFLVDLRNLFVHNRGRIDASFVQRHSGFREGDPIPLVLTAGVDADLLISALDLDERARSKFGLPSFIGPVSARECDRLGSR